MSQPPPPHLTAAAEPEVQQYRAVHPLAVIGLLLGILAITAVLSPLLWLLAWAGLAASVWALRQIAVAESGWSGRKAAQLGLGLSLAMGLAGPVEWGAHRYLLDREAQQFARLWFDTLRDRQPHKALELEVPAFQRQPLDDQLWSAYYADSQRRTRLEQFVETPPVRTLLDLGPRAEARYYQSLQQGVEMGDEQVSQLYAVSYSAGEGRVTFFVKLVLRRSPPRLGRGPSWRIDRYEGNCLPEGWEHGRREGGPA